MITHWIRNDSQPAFDPHQSCTHCLPRELPWLHKGLGWLVRLLLGLQGQVAGHTVPVLRRWGAVHGWMCWGCFGANQMHLPAARPGCAQAVGGMQLREAGGGNRAASSLSWHELTTSPLQAATTMATRTDPLKTKWIQGPASKRSIFYPCCSQKARLHSRFVASLLKAPGHCSASLI